MKPTVVRAALSVLLSFAALNAFGGGWYGMAGAEGVPTSLLEGSPFDSYFYPSSILFVIVGGSFLTAAIAVFLRHRWAQRVTYGTIVIVAGWLTVQMAIIGYVSWMQPATAVTAFVILLLARLLPAEGARKMDGTHDR